MRDKEEQTRSEDKLKILFGVSVAPVYLVTDLTTLGPTAPNFS
jgi:hypothetical protein